MVNKNRVKEYNCETCGLYKTVKSPKMSWARNGKKKILLVGETGGKNEDIYGIQFIGEAGTLLRKSLKKYQIDMDEDTWTTNVVTCRTTTNTGSNRTPTPLEIKCCAPRWREEVKELQPKIIFLLGESAVESWLLSKSPNVRKTSSITKFKRLIFPDQEFNCWVIPLYHPSFVLRNSDNKFLFDLDLEWAISQIDRDPPVFLNWDEKVRKLVDFPTIKNSLEEVINKKPIISFDYETTNIRPYHDYDQIVSIGYSDGEWGNSFPFQYHNVLLENEFKIIKELWIRILQDEKIKKIGQNVQMEEAWSRWILGTEVKGWIWDTMITSHIIDERDGYTGLDFQVFLNWGYSYGEEISQYKKDDGSGYNQMEQVPLEQLLPYNAKDALFTRLLYDKQQIQLEPSQKEANDLFFQGTLAFCDTEQNGMCIDSEYYEKIKRQLGIKEQIIEQRLLESDEALLFRMHEKKDIDLNSPKQLNKLFFEYCGLESTKFTKKGNSSVDEEVLLELNTDFTNKLLKKRKLGKLRSTYIEGMLTYNFNNKIHPNINLNLVTSFRSSGSNPNFQNLPKHDEEAMKLIRSGILPTKGNKLLEADYGALEIRMIECQSKDKELYRRLSNGIDIHQEWGDFLDIKRYDAKNAFVFPLVYKSYHRSITKELWKRGYKIDGRLVERAEIKFLKMYSGIRKFQKQTEDFYHKNGYIEYLTGFRRHGLLTVNQLSNVPTQGVGFHCLLWSLIQLNKISKERKWKTKIIYEVHDSILFDLYPSEQDEVIEITDRVMTKDILKHFKWINVPLICEFEITDINRPWSEKKTLKSV